MLTLDCDLQVDRLTDLLETKARDAHGIVRSVMWFDPIRPLQGSDFSNDVFVPSNISRNDFYSYEDSGMASGAYLACQCLRFGVAGERQSLAAAQRTFQAIRYVYGLGANQQAGYYPKPYGGRISDQVSRDQYIFVMTGLSQYLPYASREEKKEIYEMLKAMALWWVRCDYTTTYFDLPPSCHLNDFMAPLFLGLIHTAYEHTREAELLQAYEHLIDKHQLIQRMGVTLRQMYRAGHTYDNATYFRQHENPVMMKCMALDHLWDADCDRRGDWERALSVIRDDELFLPLDEASGLNYAIVGYEVEKDQTHLTPAGRIPQIDNPLGLSSLDWGGRRLRPGSAQTAYAAVVIASRLGDVSVAQKALGILNQLSFEKFRGLTAHDPQDIPPGHQWECNALHTSAMAYALWAYWLGRSRQLW